MNLGEVDSWDAEQIEAWEHDEWLLMQEMGDDYYKLHRRYEQEEEEDPFEVERRKEWDEEEEKAKDEYLKMIAEEEERSYFRKTLAEAIEEESLV